MVPLLSRALRFAALLWLTPAAAGAAPAQHCTAPVDVAQAPLAARYRVTFAAPGAQPQQQLWTFVRDANQVALLKGRSEDIWLRAPNGTVAMQRVFHDDQRVVDYASGELRTLGVDVDWRSLSGFVDPRELALLRPAGRARCSGSVGGGTVNVEWQPRQPLPARLTRTAANGAKLSFELLTWHAQRPADWPAPGAGAADYLHLDAADFGDMAYDPVVRKAEAMDIRAGWRVPHGHE